MLQHKKIEKIYNFSRILNDGYNDTSRQQHRNNNPTYAQQQHRLHKNMR